MTKKSEFRRYKNYSGPVYDGFTTQSLYITMRDGVKLALDLLLPKDLPAEEKIPALLIQTRYWRAEEFRLGLGWLERFFEPKALAFFVNHGYALVNLDVRGTGASFGTRRHEWDTEEIKDNTDIVEWIVAQPWSNGKVGGYGTSYSGNAAELLTSVGHPAVKAAIPRFGEFDSYLDIAFPGGIYLAGFLDKWSDASLDLDANRFPHAAGPIRFLFKGVKPVDADGDRRLLQQAVDEHKANSPVSDMVQRITFRDDGADGDGPKLDDFNVHTFKQEIERSGAALYGWGGWFDAGTADAVIRRFMTYDNPQLGMVGPWNHGASQHASPYAPGKADVTEHWIEHFRFFDHHLRGVDTGVMDEPLLIYFTVGEEKWKTTPTWPPEGSAPQRWHLAAGNALSPSAPDVREPQSNEAESGADEYSIDFEASTGTANRWHTQAGGGAVTYPDRAEQDLRLLTYTSPPLEADLEITGHPVVTLYVSSTHTDGAFFVYLEALDEAGAVTCLVEGQLRALHRAVSSETPPYAQFGPYHSFIKADAMPLTPGEVAELSFNLLPLSVLIKKGHRIRIAIAGADKDSFARIPAEGTPTITVARNKTHASFIDLPVVGR